jgi:ribonuclease D
VVDFTVQIHELSVDFHGNGISGKTLADAFGHFFAGDGRFKRLYTSVRKCYLNHDKTLRNKIAARSYKRAAPPLEFKAKTTRSFRVAQRCWKFIGIDLFWQSPFCHFLWEFSSRKKWKVRNMPRAVKKKVETATDDGFRFIDSDDAFQGLMKRLEGADRFACDLEADSMYHYREKVCLIQIADRHQVFIVDPFTVRDPSVFCRLLASPGIRKVFHGADYDVRSLYRDFGAEIENLFDTQIAVRFLGIEETGLESVLHRYFDLKLDKKFQKKDWSRRPLPEEMIAYAAADVDHLLPLSELLEEKLAALGRLSWVEEECRILSGVRPAENNDAPLFLRFKGAGRLRPRGLAVLEALLQYRKKVARAKDRPFFKTFSNASMQALAKARPRSLNKLKAGGSLSDRQIQMYGEDLVAVIDQAMKLPEDQLPVYPRRRPPKTNPAVPNRMRLLRTWRDRRARQLGLDPSVVMTKSLLTAIAVANPSAPEELEQIPEMRNWQREAFGRQIVAALGGSKGR